MNNTKKRVATTKTVQNTKKVEMVSTIEDIQASFGNNSILIKGNMIFRCGTRHLEKGPKSLLEYYLPNYGKMRKFIILDDGVYELVTDVKQEGNMSAKYTLSDKVNIDASNIDFSLENAWNYKKKVAK